MNKECFYVLFSFFTISFFSEKMFADLPKPLPTFLIVRYPPVFYPVFHKYYWLREHDVWVGILYEKYDTNPVVAPESEPESKEED